jgi:hypothetical protein
VTHRESKFAAYIIVRIQASEDPTSTVIEHQESEVLSIIWSVQPRRYSIGIDVTNFM